MFAYLEKSSRKNDHTRNESFDKLFLTVRQEKYAQYIRGIRHVVLRFAELSGTCNTTRWRRPRNLTRLTTNLRAYFEPLPRFSNFPISFKISTVLHTQKKERKLRIKRFKNEWNFFFEQSNIRDKKKRELSQDLDYPKFSTEEASRWPIHFRKVSEETKGKRKSSRGSTEASLIQINRPRFARGRFLRLDREGSKRRR